MRLRAAASDGLFAVLLVVGALVVVGAVTGHPLTLGYVATDSMAPGLQSGDGFITLSPLVTGAPAVGDVVVFHVGDADAGTTVHRVVDRTPEGYITKGDNSAFTDQAGGMPPVAPQQVVGGVLTVGGRVVVLPLYGHLARTVGDVLTAGVGLLGLGAYPGAALTLAIAVGGLGLIILSGSAGLLPATSRSRVRDPHRPTVDTRVLCVVLLLIVALPVATVITTGATTTRIEIVSGDPTHLPGAIAPGTHEATELTLANDRLIPALYVLEAGSPGSVIAPTVVTLPHGTRATADYTVHAPATAGRYNRFHTVHWYPLLLPVAVVLWLHALAPAAAMLALTLVPLVAVAIAFYLLVGFRELHLRESR